MYIFLPVFLLCTDDMHSLVSKMENCVGRNPRVACEGGGGWCGSAATVPRLSDNPRDTETKCSRITATERADGRTR